MQTIDVEKVIMEIKSKIITDFNGYITKIIADKALSDQNDYGMSPIPLATPNFTNNDTVMMLVMPQKVIAVDPVIFLLLENNAIEVDELDAQSITVTVRLRFSMLMDGFDDIRALRYLRALRDTFRLSRWVSPWMHRIHHIQPEEYATVEDNRSWREIGVKIETLIP
jgi:hypothetical protein